MHVVVTGAGGYIGTALVDTFLARGWEVTGVDRFFFGERLLGDTLNHPSFHLVRKDIRDLHASDLKGVDAVCDLAALSNDPSADLDPALTHDINHMGRVSVCREAKKAGVRRYVIASSCSVYGTGEEEQLSETSVPHPVTAYAKANLAAEEDVLAMADEGFCVTALRKATVFGLSKRMRFDLVINIMTLNAIETGKIFVLGGGKQWRPLVHVQDVTEVYAMVLEAPESSVNHEIFNLGSSEHNYQILSLAYIVRENIPFPVALEVAPDDADKRDYNVSFDKISNTLGFRPGIGPDEGVREVYHALKMGKVDTGLRTVTVKWYKHIFDAKALVDSVVLGDRLI